MADVATNVLRLKEWVTIPDAAKYLSGKLGTTIPDSDLLLWAKNKRLPMSIFFEILVDVKYGEIFPLKDSEKRKFNTKLASVLLDDDDPQVFLRHTEGSPQVISDLCDFIAFNVDLISASQPLAQDVIEVMYLCPNPAGGQNLKLPVEFGVIVTRAGLTALLPEEYGPNSWRQNSQLVVRTDVLEKFGEAQSPSQQNTTKNPSGDPCNAFRSMKNLTADEISITFVGDKNEYGLGVNNLVEIAARGKTKSVALAAIDLIGLHKRRLNKQCATLLSMSQKRKLPISQGNRKSISRLREVFRNHLGVNDDPFEPYRKSAGWVPRFKIFDKRGAADERAKREGIRKTDSLETATERGMQFGDTRNDPADVFLKNYDPDALV